MDQKDWVRVVDYSPYCCRSWQNLYFESRVVQYVKIVGTHNTVNKVGQQPIYRCRYFTVTFLPGFPSGLFRVYEQRKSAQDG